MSNGIAQIFRKRLDTLNISDFHGLISPGLTCYLNSVLQVLFMTEEFRDRIKSCSQDLPMLDTQLKELFTSLERNKTRTHGIAKILGIDDVYEQRDAAEYFEKILRVISPNASKIFKGQLSHMTKCYQCKNRSDAPGFFWILPLSIKEPHQIFRVDNGLNDFFCVEKVDGENKMYCVKCDEKQEAIIMCEMTEPPDVLTLLLKRFHYSYEVKHNVKLNCVAEVPLMLQIKDFTYDLYAMIKHYGTLSGGHYVAHINSVQTKEWYCFDDERVKLKRISLVPGKDVLRSRSAYLLMYRKRRRDSENDTELKEASRNSEDEDKEAQMEARRNRGDDARHMGCTMLENETEHGNDISFPSTRSHERMNCPLNSNFQTEYQESFSNQQDIHRKVVNKVWTSKSQKSLYTSDYRADKYTPSPKSRRRADHITALRNTPPRSTKLPAWKY